LGGALALFIQTTRMATSSGTRPTAFYIIDAIRHDTAAET
jgi:hypothetical protein